MRPGSAESRIARAVRRVAPLVLLVLAYSGVAEAAPAPVLNVPCSAPPANRIYRIQVGATPPSSAPEPHIEANPAATWSFPGPSSDTCTAAGNLRLCAGLRVSLPTGNATVTPDFIGTANSSSQQVRITATRGSSS